MPTINVDGMSFQVIDRSVSGEVPLLLINGMRMRLGGFNPLRKQLKAGTIAFDFPTIWWPSLSWFMSPMGDIAKVVANLVEKLGYQKIDVLGVSWGGTLAIELAAYHPELVRKLILVSTGVRAFPHFLKPATQLAYLTRGYGGKAQANPALVAAAFAEVDQSAVTTDMYRGQALFFWRGQRRLALIKQPTLIVGGTDDPITPHEEAEWIHEQIENSKLHLVDDGHVAIYTSAVEVASAINGFREV